MKKILNILEISVILIVFLVIWYKAFDFNVIHAQKAAKIFIGALISLAIIFYTEYLAQKHNFKYTRTIRKFLALPTIIICSLPGLSLLWAIGAASISFGIPFFENAFLAGTVIMLIIIIFIACLLSNNKR